MNAINFLLVINTIITVFLALSVLRRNLKDPVNFSFALFLLIGAIWPVAVIGFRMSSTVQTAWFWDVMIYTVGSAIPAALLYFSVSLFKRTKPPAILGLICMIFPIIFLFFLLFTSLWIKQISFDPQGHKIVELGGVYLIWMLYYILFMGASVLFFIKGFLKSSGFVRTQFRFILLSVTFPFLFALLPNVILPYFGNYKLIYAGPLSLTVMGLIITYAILKHRFLDIHLLVARSITYTLLLIILAVFYALGLFVFGSSIMTGPSGSTDLVVSTFLALIMAITFQPLRRMLEKFTNRIFYKGGYNTDELLYDLSQIMASSSTLKVLTENVLNVLRQKMNISKAEIAITSDLPNDKMLIFDELPEGEIKETLRQKEISVFLPLKTTHSLVAFLILGSKTSGEIYFEQDLKTLEILAPELAVAIENARTNENLQEEVKNATVELRQANEQLKELDRLKDEFISIASHDLRTPIATVKNFIWLTLHQEKNLTLKARSDLERAYNAAERTASLITDMLDVSRIEGGRMSIKIETVDLAKVISEIKDDVTSKASAKKVVLSIDSGEGISFKSDHERMLQIVNNLVDNAIKYTPAGGKVDLKINKDINKIIISVTDTGIGIDQKDFPKLFTKFGRLNNTLSGVGEVPGTGLGLYITKKLVELLHGTIAVESTIGKGTTFTCNFALESANV